MSILVFDKSFRCEYLSIAVSVSLLFHSVSSIALLSIIIISWLVVSFRRAFLYVFVDVVCCRQIIKCSQATWQSSLPGPGIIVSRCSSLCCWHFSVFHISDYFFNFYLAFMFSLCVVQLNGNRWEETKNLLNVESLRFSVCYQKQILLSKNYI